MILRKTQFNHACCAVVVVLLGVTTAATAQQCTPVRAERVIALAGGFVVAQAASLVIRSSDWWTTPTTSFKAGWDKSANREQDGLLHTAFGYHTAQVAAFAWDWTCVGPNTAAWLAAVTGLAVGLPKEIGDGIHADKGFSLRDVTWTAAGAVLPAARKRNADQDEHRCSDSHPELPFRKPNVGGI